MPAAAKSKSAKATAGSKTGSKTDSQAVSKAVSKALSKAVSKAVSGAAGTKVGSKKPASRRSPSKLDTRGRQNLCRIGEYTAFRSRCKDDPNCGLITECGKYGVGSADWPVDMWPVPKENVDRIGMQNFKDGRECTTRFMWNDPDTKVRLSECGGHPPAFLSMPQGASRRASTVSAAPPPSSGGSRSKYEPPPPSSGGSRSKYEPPPPSSGGSSRSKRSSSYRF